MRSPWIGMNIGGRRAVLAAGCLVCAWLLMAPSGALGQGQPPSPSEPEPGFFESLGRWFDQGAANFRDQWRGARERMYDFSDRAAANSKEVGDRATAATKDAVDAMVKLPTSRVMSGRERCVAAPNGAPDCLAAAEALCRKHGYSTGKSMDFTSAEECPPPAVLAAKPQAECRTVTFISRAMCQ